MDVPYIGGGDSDRLLDALDEAGCCVVESLIDPETVDRIAGELAGYRDVASVGASRFEGMVSAGPGHRCRVLPPSAPSPCIR